MKVILVATCLLVLLHSALCAPPIEREARILQRILTLLEKRTGPVGEAGPLGPSGGSSQSGGNSRRTGPVGEAGPLGPSGGSSESSSSSSSSESLETEDEGMLNETRKLCDENKDSEITEFRDLCDVVDEVTILGKLLTETDKAEDCQFEDELTEDEFENELKECLADAVADFELILDLIDDAAPGRVGAILLSKIIPDLFSAGKAAELLLEMVEEV